MFYFSLWKMFYSWPFHSDKIMQFSSWRDLPFFLIFLGLVLSPFYPSFFFQELFRVQKMNLFRFCFVFFFLTNFSSVLFSSRLVFVHHVSLSPLFHFLLCLIFDFLDLFFSWTRFFWTAISFWITKLFNLSFFTRMRSAICPLLIHLFICCLFFFSSFFSFLAHVFPFSFCLLCPQPLWKTSLWNCCKSEKHLFVYFPFCWAFFHIYLSLQFVCFFEIFSFYSHVFLNIHSSFLLSFLNVFSSITPFLCISFSWRLCLVWSSYFFSFFYFLLLHTLLVHKTPCFLNCFRLHGLFFCLQKKCFSCLLVLKKMFLCVFSFFFFFSRKIAKMIICSTSF